MRPPFPLALAKRLLLQPPTLTALPTLEVHTMAHSISQALSHCTPCRKRDPSAALHCHVIAAPASPTMSTASTLPRQPPPLPRAPYHTPSHPRRPRTLRTPSKMTSHPSSRGPPPACRSRPPTPYAHRPLATVPKQVPPNATICITSLTYRLPWSPTCLPQSATSPTKHSPTHGHFNKSKHT